MLRNRSEKSGVDSCVPQATGGCTQQLTSPVQHSIVVTKALARLDILGGPRKGHSVRIVECAGTPYV